MTTTTVEDVLDLPKGDLSWIDLSTDDSDGCQDSGEDTDDDDDLDGTFPTATALVLQLDQRPRLDGARRAAGRPVLRHTRTRCTPRGFDGGVASSGSSARTSRWETLT